MLLTEYVAHDASGLAALVRSGQAKPVELLDCALRLLERLNPEINAVVVDTRELAARDAAAPPAWAPFDGVPFLIKDLLQPVPGYPMAEGSRSQAGWVPDCEGLLVQRLRRAGFLLFGKTNTPEFGLTPTTEPELHGPTRNPWQLDRTAGGSSGGSAAAVAGRLAPAALANDSGGSLRVPSACCGVFGFKPTRGRVSDAPLHATVWGGLNANGVISRSVRDNAAILDLLAGTLPGDPYAVARPLRSFRDETKMPAGRLRIGLQRQSPSGTTVHPECVAAVEAVAKLCAALGHDIEEIHLSRDPAARDHFFTIYASSAGLARDEAARRIGRPLVAADLEPYTWALAAAGDNVTGARYMAAREFCYSTARHMARLFDTYDLILTPSLGHPPPKLGELKAPAEQPLSVVERFVEFNPFCGIANMIGHPAMSVPLYWTAEGVPLGAHFIGRFAGEDVLYRVAAQLEAAHPWIDRLPPVLEKALAG